MATTEQILEAAKELGKLIESHEVSEKLSAAAKSLDTDTTAQRAVADFSRAMMSVETKAAQGMPIEVSDKQALESARVAVATHPILSQFQTAQFEMSDLLRKIDEVMLANNPLNQGGMGGTGVGAGDAGEPEGGDPAGGPSPILSV